MSGIEDVAVCMDGSWKGSRLRRYAGLMWHDWRRPRASTGRGRDMIRDRDDLVMWVPWLGDETLAELLDEMGSPE